MWYTIISDNFNRTNGTVGNGWIETTANTWTINSNKLKTVGNVPNAVTNIDYYYNTITRLVNNKFNPIPKQIIINLGTNDAINNINTTNWWL